MRRQPNPRPEKRAADSFPYSPHCGVVYDEDREVPLFCRAASN
jgi:hypothetical protein